MATNKKKINVLLYGDIFWPYHRPQNLLKFLVESEYSISLVSPSFYNLKGIKEFSIAWKFLIRLHLIELFLKAPFVRVIYILPLNTTLIRNAILVSRLFKKKLVVEIFESLYDSFVIQGKIFKEGSRRAKTAIENDRLALTKPDYIITTTKHEPTHWEKILGSNIDINKVFVAPIFSGSTSTLMLKRNFMQDGILRICWWGTFSEMHGLDRILESMKLLKETKVPFTCNLFGVDNPSFNVYAEKIQSKELDSCVFLRKDLKFFDDSLPMYLVENCDLALGVFGNTDRARNAFPYKLVEALSMGIPTLTMNSSALAEFLDPEIDLWTCEPFPEPITETIFTIVSDTAHPVDWQQTRQKVLDTFSVIQYQKVVSEVLNKVTSN
jgi:glycosyltransferase involved in cell wall biosynthesis